MSQAIELAKEAAIADEVPVGALLICDDRIIGQGRNSREETHRTVAHAEVMALEDYSRKTGEWRLPPETMLMVTTEPCLMCTGALLWARVTHLYFGCSDPRNAGIFRLIHLIEAGTYDHRFKTLQGGILSRQCGQLMSAYFQAKRSCKTAHAMDVINYFPSRGQSIQPYPTSDLLIYPKCPQS